MNFIKVHNINDSKILKKEIWEEKKREKVTLCSCKGCIQKADLISNVKINDVEEGKIVYSIPVCNECSNKAENYYVDIDSLVI